VTCKRKRDKCGDNLYTLLLPLRTRLYIRPLLRIPCEPEINGRQPEISAKSEGCEKSGGDRSGFQRVGNETVASLRRVRFNSDSDVSVERLAGFRGNSRSLPASLTLPPPLHPRAGCAAKNAAAVAAREGQRGRADNAGEMCMGIIFPGKCGVMEKKRKKKERRKNRKRKKRRERGGEKKKRKKRKEKKAKKKPRSSGNGAVMRASELSGLYFAGKEKEVKEYEKEGARMRGEDERRGARIRGYFAVRRERERGRCMTQGSNKFADDVGGS